MTLSYSEHCESIYNPFSHFVMLHNTDCEMPLQNHFWLRLQWQIFGEVSTSFAHQQLKVVPIIKWI